MASANLDLVRSIFADWERGDFSSADWAHPDIELVLADGPSPGHWTGRAGLAAGWRAILSAFEHYQVEPHEYRELDDERVLVLVRRRHGRGKTSGLDLKELKQAGATIFHLRDGHVTKLVLYFEGEHALAELALAPDPDAPDA